MQEPTEQGSPLNTPQTGREPLHTPQTARAPLPLPAAGPAVAGGVLAAVPLTAEPDNPDPQDPLFALWGPVLAAIALCSSIATFLYLMGIFRLSPTERAVPWLLAIDTLLLAALLYMVVWQLWQVRRASREKQSGARLHRRIVGLFSLVAIVPTAIVAGAALVALERGLTPWFSGNLRALVLNADAISHNFQQQICQNLGREIRLMAQDMDRTQASGFFTGNESAFQTFFNGRAVALGFPYAVIFSEKGTLLKQAQVEAKAVSPPQLAQEDFRDADTDEIPCLFSRESMGGLIRLRHYGDGAYLVVARAVDPRILEFPIIAKAGVAQYQVLEQRRQASKFGIAVVFALLTLIGLTASVMLGLGFANKLVDPIRRLMRATDAVAAGNLDVQVPTAKLGADIAQLGAVFNNMTQALRDQHANLHEAYRLLDQRRHFIEAVLAGVPAGVVGVDAKGRISLINPMAREWLRLPDPLGAPVSATELPLLNDILPELGAFVAEARAQAQNRVVQTEIPLLRGGRERVLSVRATGDEEGGLVITLDDMTDLISAQRNAAWSDVARRIAHEIKNPLTPIQLSVDRIRRKFGKHIHEDKPIFDQCTETIIRQVEDIKAMVDSFSSFAKMPKPVFQPDDLARTLRETVFLMRVGNPDITFDERGLESPLPAVFDRRLIAQAFQNLLKNACEAIAENEQASAPGRIVLEVYPQGEGLVVEVRDNGKGFPLENRARLLEPYATTRQGGTGLGLPIVAKIFEDHGGRLELLDAAQAASGQGALQGDKGALVRVYLPRDLAPRTQQPEGMV